MAAKRGKAVTGMPPLYDRIREILETARTSAARTVNTTLVVANWLIGREIVEEEQAGKRRAVYGAELLRDLAAGLKVEFGSGYGVDNLELFRRFYLEYPQLLPRANSDAARRKSGLPEKSDAVRRKSLAALEIRYAARSESWQPGRLNPGLSWTHYRTLLRTERSLLVLRTVFRGKGEHPNLTGKKILKQVLFDEEEA